MPADPSIYGAIRQPEAFNPLAEMAQFEQLRGAQQQNQLAALAFGDRQRAIADAEAQRAAVRGFGTDTTANYNRLLQTGNLGAAQGYQKGITEQQKAAGDIASTSVKTAGSAFDNFKAILGTVQDPQQAEQFVIASYNDPTVGPILQKMGPLEMGIQKLRDLASTPQGFQQWKANAAIGIEKLAEMAKVNVVNNGGANQTIITNPALGTSAPVGPAMPITQSADNAATQATSRANNAETVGASYANAGATREVAKATRDAATIAASAKSETDIRKEFADLPETKKYKNAIPAYSSLVNAAKTNNPQADINLIYGLAKLYDPDSVVREGEYATIANSQAVPDWLKGQAQRLVGGGRLTENTKAQILDQAKIRLDSYKGEYDSSRGAFERIVKGRGLDPANVLTPVGESVPKAPATPAPAANVDALVDRYRTR